jgi:hypothetical protein
MKTVSVWCHDKEGDLITNSRNVIVKSIENLIKTISLILALKKSGCYNKKEDKLDIISRMF